MGKGGPLGRLGLVTGTDRQPKWLHICRHTHMSTRGNPVIATICHHLLHVGKLTHILEWLI